MALQLESAAASGEAALERPVELARSAAAGLLCAGGHARATGRPARPPQPARRGRRAGARAARRARRHCTRWPAGWRGSPPGPSAWPTPRTASACSRCSRSAKATFATSFIELFGGSPKTESAVDRGLKWIAAQQAEDGNWSLHEFPGLAKGTRNAGQGKTRSDTAATGFALLPFLGTGHTHLEGKYQKQVAGGYPVARRQPETGRRPVHRWRRQHAHVQPRRSRPSRCAKPTACRATPSCAGRPRNRSISSSPPSIKRAAAGATSRARRAIPRSSAGR